MCASAAALRANGGGQQAVVAAHTCDLCLCIARQQASEVRSSFALQFGRVAGSADPNLQRAHTTLAALRLLAAEVDSRSHEGLGGRRRSGAAGGGARSRRCPGVPCCPCFPPNGSLSSARGSTRAQCRSRLATSVVRQRSGASPGAGKPSRGNVLPRLPRGTSPAHVLVFRSRRDPELRQKPQLRSSSKIEHRRVRAVGTPQPPGAAGRGRAGRTGSGRRSRDRRGAEGGLVGCGAVCMTPAICHTPQGCVDVCHAGRRGRQRGGGACR